MLNVFKCVYLAKNSSQNVLCTAMEGCRILKQGYKRALALVTSLYRKVLTGYVSLRSVLRCFRAHFQKFVKSGIGCKFLGTESRSAFKIYPPNRPSFICTRFPFERIFANPPILDISLFWSPHGFGGESDPMGCFRSRCQESWITFLGKCPIAFIIPGFGLARDAAPGHRGDTVMMTC
jgi:hypothetical protein